VTSPDIVGREASTLGDRGPEAPLRVCAVIQGFHPAVGGAELQYERLLPLLARRGVEVTVLTRAQPGCPRKETMQRATVRRTHIAGTSAIASASFILESLAYVLRHRTRIDLVHAHGALSEGTIALGAHRLGVPGLVKVLRAGPYGDLRTLERRPAGRRRMLSLVRHLWFVSISLEVRCELVTSGAASERILDIPNGVDVAVYHPAAVDERERLRDALGLPPGTMWVAVGRLHPVKRFDLVIRALAELPSGNLVLVGDGPEARRLGGLARELGVSERVQFAGLARNVPDYLRAADGFLLPSAGEGLSNALLEAMACGLPCLAAPASGVAQLLSEQRGVVVDGDDPGAWADAMRSLAADGRIGAEMGARAAAHVRSSFALESTADALVAAYRMIADARP
jgi:glycosyltransferase involved in cell wall biosynthesis